ncbi:MAG: four helix bundle protein [Chloroflexota bacterium]
MLAVYEATRAFPKDELYGLTSQLRRCSSSIPSNIVEGCGRSSNAELAKFLHYALGSANELEYQLLLSRDLGFLSPENIRSSLRTPLKSSGCCPGSSQSSGPHAELMRDAKLQTVNCKL